METQKLVSMVKEALDKYSYPLTAKNIKAVIQKEYKVVLPTGSINSILYSNTELFEKVDKTNTIYPPLWIRKTN
ncbi:pI73R [African swine fever virus]|uniref:BA71V-I73R (K10R) n=1 Tax=African swine fever virus TaxID=10497 RepID=A0A0C5B0B6_ASF|nr:BA71V-I73R (k10R) [African swine fever virus]UYB79292.1 pI73R [Recombinant African swine fever virus]AJL34315.1 BA71V-I73R (k10R) [African swine fever virus]AXB49367.1 pI73R [African swine fever virus]AXB49541.1 pI73R [African swine fever virus]AXB49713.1 pI73R [African swine fever virus]